MNPINIIKKKGIKEMDAFEEFKNPSEPKEESVEEPTKSENLMAPKANQFSASADCDPSLGIRMIPRYNFQIMVSKDYVAFSIELIEFMQKIRMNYCQYDYLTDGYKVRDALDSNGDIFNYKNVHEEFTNNLEYMMHMDTDKPLAVTFGITKDNNLSFAVQVVELCSAQPFQLVYDKNIKMTIAKTPYLKYSYPFDIKGYYLVELIDATNVFICTKANVISGKPEDLYFKF